MAIKITNVKVNGIEEAFRGSKLPMATEPGTLNSDVTNTIKKLGSSKIGEGHDTFLNGIIVHFDVEFTIKAWTEAERYTFLNFVSSQSTMHRLSRMDIENQYSEYVDPRMIEIMKELQDKYTETQSTDDYLRLVYSNPVGCKLTASMVTNYRQLKTIYYQRRTHRLPEWREFCEWITTLPYFKEVVLGE